MQPESISDRAGSPAPRVTGRPVTTAWSTLEVEHWNHFAEGDRVLVFGRPDPATGRRRVRRGTVLAPPSAEIIKIVFENDGSEEFSPADRVHVSHAAGACRCVVAIS